MVTNAALIQSWERCGHKFRRSTGELGCYGGGVLRGAPTPRIDKLAGEGLRAAEFQRGGAVHAEPVGAADGAARDPLGHADCRGDGRPGWPDSLRDDHRPGAVGRGIRDADVGQLARGQRPGGSQPGRLRVRRGRLVAAHCRRGAVDHAVLLPRRGGHCCPVRGGHACPDRARLAEISRRTLRPINRTPATGSAVVVSRGHGSSNGDWSAAEPVVADYVVE